MRAILSAGGIYSFVSTLEWELLHKYANKPIEFSKLTQFESQKVIDMYKRGVLIRKKTPDGIFYLLDKN